MADAAPWWVRLLAVPLALVVLPVAAVCAALALPFGVRRAHGVHGFVVGLLGGFVALALLEQCNVDNGGQD